MSAARRRGSRPSPCSPARRGGGRDAHDPDAGQVLRPGALDDGRRRRRHVPQRRPRHPRRAHRRRRCSTPARSAAGGLDAGHRAARRVPVRLHAARVHERQPRRRRRDARGRARRRARRRAADDLRPRAGRHRARRARALGAGGRGRGRRRVRRPPTARSRRAPAVEGAWYRVTTPAGASAAVTPRRDRAGRRARASSAAPRRVLRVHAMPAPREWSRRSSSTRAGATAGARAAVQLDGTAARTFALPAGGGPTRAWRCAAARTGRRSCAAACSSGRPRGAGPRHDHAAVRRARRRRGEGHGGHGGHGGR